MEPEISEGRCDSCSEDFVLRRKVSGKWLCALCLRQLTGAQPTTAHRPQAVTKPKPGLISRVFKLVVLAIVALFVGVCFFMGKVASDTSGGKAAGTAKTDDAPKLRSESANQPKVHGMGEMVSVGYTSYCLWKSEWRGSLGSGPLQQRPNAAFLVLQITVRNDDKKARTVPPLKLVDENGASYEAATAGMLQGDEWFNVLESLNPSVSKQGNIAFDVPRDHKYRLEVSGGFWSGKTAFIEVR